MGKLFPQPITVAIPFKSGIHFNHFNIMMSREGSDRVAIPFKSGIHFNESFYDFVIFDENQSQSLLNQGYISILPFVTY